jgi:acetyltransferase-like isoleucine patch superfamily enzyme
VTGEATRAAFTIDRVLVAGDTLESALGDARLAALVRERPATRPLALTVALREDADGEGVRAGLARLAPARAPGVRLARRGEPVEALLSVHDALLACGAPPDRALIVRAWQRGLCVVNGVEQAARVAAFQDDYVDAGGAGRWYSIMEGSPVIVSNPQHVVLEYGARINPRAVIHNESTITIGRGSLLGADAELNLYTARFVMGQFCHTSSYFAAVGSRHTLHSPSTFAVSRGPYAFLGEPADKVGDIVIGNDVWFGMRVIVLPGVRVADGCVVGAGSVVTDSLTEPYGIYAGNPARLIRHRFPPHVVKWLCAVQWWNWPTRKLAEAREFFRTDISSKREDELWGLIDR